MLARSQYPSRAKSSTKGARRSFLEAAAEVDTKKSRSVRNQEFGQGSMAGLAAGNVESAHVQTA